jgi:hypothetical protein
MENKSNDKETSNIMNELFSYEKKRKNPYGDLNKVKYKSCYINNSFKNNMKLNKETKNKKLV